MKHSFTRQIMQTCYGTLMAPLADHIRPFLSQPPPQEVSLQLSNMKFLAMHVIEIDIRISAIKILGPPLLHR